MWYSQELRPYALVLLLGLIAMTSVTKLLTKPAAGWWVVFVVSTAASLYLHYLSIVLLPLQLILLVALVAVARTQWPDALLWLAGWGAAGLAYWPWLRTPAARAFFRPSTISGSYFADLLASRLGIAADLSLLTTAPLVIGALVIGVAGLVVFFRLIRWAHGTHHLRRLRDQGQCQVILIVLYAALLVASVVPRGYTFKRQLVVLWPYGLMLFAWFWPWAGRFHRLLVGMLALSLVAALVNVLWIPKPQWREVAEHIAERHRTGDVVVLEPAYMATPFGYHADAGIEREGLGFGAEPTRLDALLGEHDRVWLVIHRSTADPQQRTQNWFDEHGTLVESADFFRLHVRLYVPRE